MLQSNKSFIAILLTIALFSISFLSACGDDPVSPVEDLRSETFTYAFNEGQALGDENTAYRGEHQRNLNATILIEELENGNASVTVTLENTINGETYPVHAHDAADPSTTPNGTPYNETPNGDIFAGGIEGNGGTASASNESTLSYDALINQYEGFFVVHDPTQDVSTTDLTTYLVLGVFASSLPAGDSSLRSETFSYAFNEGQLLDDSDTAYEGDHPRNLSATILIEERGNGMANVTVSLENTLSGFDYPVHVHDAADPATTPNGTPYNETPNGDLFAGGIAGGSGTVVQQAPRSKQKILYTEI